METRRLEYFRAVAEDGNFSRAAARLNMTQPALSQQIQRLEQEVGADLFDRTSRPVVLTDIGERLLVHSAELLDHVRSIERLRTAAGRGETGTLRIGVIPAMLFGGLPARLRAFRRLYPDVHVSLHRMDTAPLLDMLEAGRLDVGFVHARPDPPVLRHRALDRSPLAVALPTDHPLAGAAELRLADLRAEPLVLFPRQSAPENVDTVLSACMAEGFSPRVVTTSGGYADQAGYVAAGLGWALLPADVDGVHAEDVVRVPLTPGIAFTERVVWRAPRPNSRVRALLAHLEEA
jgi:DNA-binding transcriptional LysR family regulator